MNLAKLNHFVGKVCTVFTHPTNRNFKEENPATFPKQLYHYFLGVIESIDDDGVMLTHIQNGTHTFIFKEGLIAIAEEEVLDPTKPDDAKVIESFKSVSLQPKPERNQSQLLDVAGLSAIANKKAQKL